MVDINVQFTTIIAPTPASAMVDSESLAATHPYQHRGFDVLRHGGTVRGAPSDAARPIIPSKTRETKPVDSVRSTQFSSTDTFNAPIAFTQNSALMEISEQIDFISRSYAKPARQEPSAVARRILRQHFLKDIVRYLQRLEQQAQRPESADYANKLFHAMRAVRDRLMTDPFSAVVIALHDALAFQNGWARYDAQQYNKAREILVRFGNQDLHEEKALKAIAALEEVGFDTTPFFTTPNEDLASA
jgi:hypothetical protein